MWKFWFTLIANIGGWVALATLVRDLWQHRLRMSVYVLDYYSAGKLLFAHFTLVNRSTMPISILKMTIKMADGTVCELSQNAGFVLNKHYGNDYTQEIFTSQLPINLAPKSAANVLLEVIDCDEPFKNIASITVITDKRTKSFDVVKTDIRLVNQYQFR
jgi:hypothetical protein